MLKSHLNRSKSLISCEIVENPAKLLEIALEKALNVIVKNLFRNRAVLGKSARSKSKKTFEIDTIAKILAELLESIKPVRQSSKSLSKSSKSLKAIEIGGSRCQSKQHRFEIMDIVWNRCRICMKLWQSAPSKSSKPFEIEDLYRNR